jgi:hypothetical protein
MQYKVKVIAVGGPNNGKSERIFTTPDILAPSTKEAAHQYEVAAASRLPLGDVEGVPIVINGFGNVFALIDGREAQLSPNVEQYVEGVGLRREHYKLTCELVREPQKRLDDRGLRLRLWHWLRGARCGNCFYFDVATAHEWRDRVTHKYSDGQYDKMWHDVTKLSAEQHYVPDMVKGEFGFCAAKGVGLSGTLPACKRYKRRPPINTQAAATEEKK